MPVASWHPWTGVVRGSPSHDDCSITEGRSWNRFGTTDVPLHRFSTEEGQDGDWRPSGELRILLDDGRGTPLERVSWSDRRGNAASVVLTAAVATAAVHAAPGELRDITDTVVDVEASGEFAAGGEVARNLLDRSPSKWLVHEDTAELDFTLQRPAAVASYRLTTANDASGHDPQDWHLQGSHDGGTWTTLDTPTGEHFTRRFETRDFPFANTTSYRHYRLRITDNAGSGELQLSQVEFLAGAGKAPAPAASDFIGYYGPGPPHRRRKHPNWTDGQKTRRRPPRCRVGRPHGRTGYGNRIRKPDTEERIAGSGYSFSMT
ncbi:discoidin domain-containing protein [Streptomyces sp. NBC_01275]|uniref:discoidin domain-containing protein n=1 Tax=Streptomyces sp. NBC_01275 TaxID=2903807 RepID=UPI0022522D6C|nr:discoidin domain-containing protein [Streptomyces sp. NBC_01275]MCX4763017.1 discoidin domain-containing protein [Streptomyces sp. NBC_01275]